MDYNKILLQSEKRAKKAKDGIVRHNKESYSLCFNHVEWIYTVYNSEGTEIIRINSKSLSNAKKILIHYLDN